MQSKSGFGAEAAVSKDQIEPFDWFHRTQDFVLRIGHSSNQNAVFNAKGMTSGYGARD